ncbi:MAG: hypothetical protein IKI33_00330 [Eubacterium sp.]|nr:hypothetical protein [Eubacterium sp.]
MKREQLSNLAMIAAILVILGYIFFEVYSVSHIEVKTETAVISTVYEKVDAKAIIIRDEQTIGKSSGAITVPCLNDGDKINVGGNTAMTFSSQDAATNYSKYAEIQNELAYYENLESQTQGQAASVESIDSEIKNNVNLYVRTVNEGNLNAISAAGDKLNDGLVRRQMIIGEKVDLLSIIQDLRNQSEKYANNSKPDSFIKTDVSGVFSSYTDGFEGLLDYDKAEELTAEQVENAIEMCEKNKNNTDFLGKLVTSYKWYMECVVDADKVRELTDGGRVNVAFKDSNDTVLTATIVSGADTNIGQKKTLLIMKCSNMDSNLASLRCEDIELRIKSHEGIMVPASALHVNENGEKGVYALVASQVHFRKAEVIYSTDDYVMLKFDPDSENGIRLYDQIITQGKELKDGKVFD